MNEHLQREHKKDTRKFEKLTSAKKEEEHTEKRKKWVCNLSQRKLKKQTATVMVNGDGLNFATPINIPYEEFIVAIACHKITNQGNKASLCSEAAGILKSAKITHKNTNREELKAIQTITKDKTIKDKGRSVIMDTEQYESQRIAMLEDKDT